MVIAMGEWEEKRLSAVVDIISGGTPKTEVSEYWNGDIYWLAVNDFSGDMRWVRKSEKTITQSGLDNSATKILNTGDLILSARGTVGELAQIGTPMAFNQSCYGLRGKNGYDNNFLYYALKQQLKQLKSVANGAVFDTIILKTFDHIKVTIPQLPTQARIADILSAYDNAIENNNRRIALLEKAARDLYREWFVRMRFPGYESVKFVNGLPEGWAVMRLGEFCHVTDGTHDTPKPTDDGVPLVTGKHISNGFIDFNGTYLISEADHVAISRRSGLDSGDILISNIGTVGSICVVDYDREFSVKNVIILKPMCIIKTAYLYFLMTSSILQDTLSAQSSGASQQFIGLTFMRRFKIMIPNESLLEMFAEKITPILMGQQKLHKQSQNLARQRDLLLPRLMSGKM
jgi:type I restriction enzyme S subunit